MKLLKICTDKNQIKILKNTGLTLVEILVVIGIIAIIFSGGFYLSQDSLKRQTFFSQEKMFLSLLRLARSRSLANFNQLPQGLYFDSHSFVLFQGLSYDPDSKSNEVFPKSKMIAISNNLNTKYILFQNLSGRVDFPLELRFYNDTQETIIQINKEGGIN